MKTIHLSCACGARIQHTDRRWRVDESAEEFRRAHTAPGCAVKDETPAEAEAAV